MAVMLKAGKYNKVITIEARNYPREREPIYTVNTKHFGNILQPSAPV
nr:MAG TPA: hypothetical protein [Caudoviricetes sp.]